MKRNWVPPAQAPTLGCWLKAGPKARHLIPHPSTCPPSTARHPFAPCSYSDAEDAVRGRDGYDFYGNRLRVELAKGAGGRGGGGGFGGGGPRGFGGAPPPGFRPRQTGFRVLVRNLPMSASWQDLKVRAWGGVGWVHRVVWPGAAWRGACGGNTPGQGVRQWPPASHLLPSRVSPPNKTQQDFIRQVCKPAYTNVFRDRDGVVGVVEFETGDDMDRVIRWVLRAGGGWKVYHCGVQYCAAGQRRRAGELGLVRSYPLRS